MNQSRIAAIVLIAGLLSGCTSMNLFKDSGGSASAPPPEPTPDQLEIAPEKTLVPGNRMSAAQIRKALSGKSWRWSTPTNGLSGVTLFADDGSSLVEVTGKGTTTGKWEARDGQLCESLAPAPFLPNGRSQSCQSVTGSGNTFKVGPATFTLA